MKAIITKIEVQKRNKKRVNVFIDDTFAFACSMELVYRHRLEKGVEIDESSFEEILEEDEFVKCKNEALKALEKSYRTEKQIKDKLLKKEYSGKIVEKVIGFLREYNFLDDEKYAEAYIQSKAKTGGRQKIKSDLLRKGFSSKVVEEKMNGIDRQEQREVALQLGRKKYDSLVKREQDAQKLYKKVGQHLLSKGYEYEEIKYVLNSLFKKDIEE